MCFMKKHFGEVCIRGSFSLYFGQLFKGLTDAIICIENGPIVSKIFRAFLGDLLCAQHPPGCGSNTNTKRSEKNLALQRQQIPRRGRHRSGCTGGRDLPSWRGSGKASRRRGPWTWAWHVQRSAGSVHQRKEFSSLHQHVQASGLHPAYWQLSQN